MTNRIWEIDALRGFCILLMVSYHFIFDLNYFFAIDTIINIHILSYAVYFFAGVFIFVSGISSHFSRNTLKRGLIVLLAAALISVATYLYDKSEFIVFGILQFLGVSMIIIYFLKKALNKLNELMVLIIGLLFVVIGIYMSNIIVSTNLLLPLGLIPASFSSLDYFPLLPWFGVFLSGYVFGSVFYRERKTLFPRLRTFPIFEFLGRNSLIIYLLHQPILFGLFYIIFGK